MATTRYDKSQLKFYVERAVPDPQGNRLFESDPLELVVYVDTDGSMDNDVVKISGTCRGATRNAGGTGSIIGYHIAGLYATEGVTWGKFNDVSGVALPVDRTGFGLATKRRKSKINDTAYLTAGFDSTDPFVETATIKIVTTNNPIQINIPEPPDINYPLGFRRGEVEPKRRNTGVLSNHQFDAGTILFEDFVFYGDYSNLTYLTLELETTKDISNASDYPFTIDLYALVSDNRGKNLNIEILSVKEYTPSLRKTDLTDAIDENGVLAYAPQGNYLRNRLVIEVEISEEFPKVSILARQTTQQASSPYSTTPDGTRRLLPIGSEKQPKMKMVLGADVDDNVIGDPDEEARFWINQGNNGTCLLAAVGSILNSDGIATYDDLLARTVVRINAHGQIIDADGNVVSLDSTGVDILIDGQAPYIQIVEPLLPEVAQRYEEIYPGITKYIAPGVILPNPNLSQNWGWAEIMFDAFNVESHTGYASNFATILEELGEGNKIVAYVDGKELWQSPLVDFISGSEWIPFQAERSIQNHALWITGVEIDGDEAFILVNDSGDPSGRNKRYPLEKFLDSFEDAEFIYQATGRTAPDNAIQTERHALQSDISKVVSGRIVEINGREIQFPENFDFTNLENFNRKFNNYLKDPDFVSAMDAELPGFKNRVGQYIAKVNEQRERVIRDLGLDPDEIEEIFDEVDVE